MHLKTVDWSYNNFTLHLLDDVPLSLWTRKIQLCNIHTLTYTLNSEVRLRDDFNFPVVNFPFICSNISAPCEYGACYFRLLVPIRISVIEDCCWKRYWTKSSWWLDLNDHFKGCTVVISTWLTGVSVLSMTMNMFSLSLSSLVLTWNQIHSKSNTIGAWTGPFPVHPWF
jgi:hypothetical protein